MPGTPTGGGQSNSILSLLQGILGGQGGGGSGLLGGGLEALLARLGGSGGSQGTNPWITGILGNLQQPPSQGH
jgi:hypothetical protein